jgi:hypothetical protein
MWEYQSSEMAPDRDPQDVQATLNALGAQRWELVANYVSNAGYNVFICKRPVERGRAGYKLDLDEQRS